MTRRARVLRAARERRHGGRQRPKYAGWMSVTTGRPVGRREPAPDNPWTAVKIVALSITFLLWIAWYAPQLPERRVPADPRGYSGVGP